MVDREPGTPKEPFLNYCSYTRSEEGFRIIVK